MMMLAGLAVIMAGCARPGTGIATRPAAARGPATPPRDNALLVAWIGDQPYVTAEAACRSIWWLWRGEAGPGSFEALLSGLREAGIAPPGWTPEPTDKIRRATAGYMLCRTIGLRSGLNWRLFGLGRYAWRELVYRGLALPAGELGFVRGGEFLGLLQRCEGWMIDRRRATYPHAELGSMPAP